MKLKNDIFINHNHNKCDNNVNNNNENNKINNEKKAIIVTTIMMMMMKLRIVIKVICVIVNSSLTVSYYHVTYVFQSESTSYSCLNVKELLPQNRRHI